MINVFVVASNPALRAGLRALLTSDEGIVVAGEAIDLSAIEAWPPEMDVLLLALPPGVPALTEMDFHEALGEHQAYPAVLVMGDDPQAAGVLPDLPVPAWGMLPADASPSELGSAMHALGEGLIVGTVPLLKPLLNAHRPVQLASNGAGEEMNEPLTPREIEVLQLLAQGLANKQIATALAISEHTVKFHVSSVYAKLGAVNRTEAVRIGTRRGLIVF